jgi:hypothetical protein
LNLYENEKDVMHVSGFMFPVKSKLPQTCFFNFTSIWGWGTWSRAWKFMNNDLEFLWNKLNQTKRMEEFTLSYSNGLDDIFKAALQGQLNPPFDLKWHTSIFLQNGYSLHPYKSLTRNIGHDDSAIHTKKKWWSKFYAKQKIADSVEVIRIPIEENLEARMAVREFYLSLTQPPFYVKVQEKIKLILNI